MDSEQRVLEAAPPPVDRTIWYGSDPNQFIDVRFPAGMGPWPGILAIHGGFWRAQYDLAYFGLFCAAMAGEGFVTFNIEYRRVGQPGGGWPGTFHDVASAAEHVFAHADKLRLDAEQLIAAGHSAGGHLALWLGGRHCVDLDSPITGQRIPLRAAVSLGGAIDLHQVDELRLGDDAVRDFLGGSANNLADRFAAASPAALLPMGLTQLIVHGDQDADVPIGIADQYIATARAAGDDVRSLLFEGIGHFEIVEPGSTVWPDVVHAIRDLSGLDGQ